MAKTFTQTAKNNGRRALITRQKQKEGEAYREREREHVRCGVNRVWVWKSAEHNVAAKQNNGKIVEADKETKHKKKTRIHQKKCRKHLAKYAKI